MVFFEIIASVAGPGWLKVLQSLSDRLGMIESFLKKIIYIMQIVTEKPLRGDVNNVFS